MPTLLAVLLACTGAPADTGAGVPVDENHPVAPDEYEDRWDVDAETCDDAIVYWRFVGEIDDAGALTGQETWYWFFSDEGWDDDCADVFDVAGAEEATPVADDPCLSCDRDFTVAYSMDDGNRDCPLDGYESLLDNDSRDRIDEEEYVLALMLDTDPLGGDAGEVNVWSFVQDDQDTDAYNERAMSLGTFTPTGEVTGPGAIEWSLPDGMCVTIREED